MPQASVGVLRSLGREPLKLGGWILFPSLALCLLPSYEVGQGQEKPHLFLASL